MCVEDQRGKVRQTKFLTAVKKKKKNNQKVFVEKQEVDSSSHFAHRGHFALTIISVIIERFSAEVMEEVFNMFL